MNSKLYINLVKAKAQGFVSKIRQELGITRSVIGIDVGLSSVKVVQMAHVGGEITVIKSAYVDIGGLPGNQDEVLASLKTALIGMEMREAKVVAIVNCPQTCTRKILAPHMPKKELVEAVRWEARNAIPFSIDEAMMDFEVLGEVADKGVKKLIVAVAAAPKVTVRKILSLCAKAGIELSALIPMSMGLQNIITLSSEDQKRTVAVVEMGASITELNIFCEGRLAFSRKLPVSGNDITRAMTSTLMSSQGKIELSPEEAEKIKRDQGIPTGEEAELVDGKILPSQILSLVRPCVEQLAGEIERSFDFYREESHGGRVDKIILFGGGAHLKRLVESLHNELEVEIEIGDALKHVKAVSGAFDGKVTSGLRFDLAIGAALSKSDKLNLLPKEHKDKAKRLIENTSLKGVAVGVIVSLLLFYAGLHVKAHGLNKKIGALTLEQKTLDPKIKKLRTGIAVDGILKDQPYWEDVLKEIGNVIPAKINLTYLGMENDLVRLRGNILKSDQNAQGILSQFMLTLEDGIFQNVSLVSTQKKEDSKSVSEFEITCTVE